MKLQLLLTLVFAPIFSASATFQQHYCGNAPSIHRCGIITGGFCTESANGKTQEEAHAKALNQAYSKYRGSNFKITSVTFTQDSFGYICHLDLEFYK